jgi:integrase
MRSRKHQKGSIVLRSGKWYVRFYGSDRVQRNEFLHIKDEEFHSKTCKAVRGAAAKVMARINAELGQSQHTVGEFFDNVYWPWVEANKRPSTSSSYKDLWDRHLKPHCGATKIATYKTSDASKFLTKLAESGLGRNSISHLRSLFSGIMSHALNLGVIDRNPLEGAKVLSKVKQPADTESYSLREVEDMMEALAGQPDSRLLVSLCGFLGLRPSEANGLGWDCVDLDQGAIHLRRAFVRGVLGDLKTDGSAQTLPLIGPVRMAFDIWATKTAKRKWVFENGAGEPADFKRMIRNRIKPAIERWNKEHGEERAIRWLGLYAFRRTAASSLWSLTGSVEASQLLLRHKMPDVTFRHYVKSDRSELSRGLKLLESKLAKKDLTNPL